MHDPAPPMPDSPFAHHGREYPAGDVLFHEGDPGDTVFVILSGAVRLTKRLAGEEKVQAVRGPGDLVGELAFLSGSSRSCTATVVGTARCLVLGAETIEEMVVRSAEIVVLAIRERAEPLDPADVLAEIGVHRDLLARVMLTLSLRAAALREQADGRVHIRTTPEDIAREVGIDVAVVHEVLAKLRRLHLVTDGPDAGIAADRGRLQGLLQRLGMSHHVRG